MSVPGETSSTSRNASPRRRKKSEPREEDPVATFNDEHQLAVFIDLENVAIGVRDAKLESFDIGKVFARLVEKGKIAFRKAYADWAVFSQYKRPFHEHAVELVDIPRKQIGATLRVLPWSTRANALGRR